MAEISIITINYNNSIGLHRTMSSVFSQTYRAINYIVIDGASTDDSRNIITTFGNEETDNITFNWISEPDNGIYDAMNKGLKIATGEYCLFLNSGDYLADENTIQKIVDCNPTEDVCYFDAYFLNDDGRKCKRTYPDKLTLSFFYADSLCHQAMLYKKDLLLQVGGYDERFRLIADWALNVKLIILQNCSAKHYPIITTFYELGGRSSTNEGRKCCAEEKELFFAENLPPRILYDYRRWYDIQNLDWYRRIARLSSRRLHKVLLFVIKVLDKLDRL